MTLIGSLLKLKDHAFEGSTWEPKEREFRKLKFLHIHILFALLSLLQTLELQQTIQYQSVKQITSLKEKGSRLLKILDHSSETTRRIKDLEGRIRDASYEAEDTIESLKARQVLLESLCTHFRRSEEYVRRNIDVGFQGLEKVIDEFDSILDDLSDKIKDGIVEDRPPRNSLTAGSSRFVADKERTPVGIDEDLLQMKDRLTGSPSKLDVISIIGMAGTGKTTLARSLYDDLLIEQHFVMRAWIVVSQEYHLREVFAGLLDSTRCRGDEFVGNELQHKSIEQLAERLHKSLKGRRYLIVMDDVWDAKAWNDVRRFFPDDNNGSRIILTTRLSKVASYANSCSPVHSMSLLSSEASWNLLREKVFGKECCPSALENTGKKIAKNCKGLPLAIVVIGGLLSKGNKTQEYWEYIAENVNSAVSGNDDQFMEILSLSYNSLPHHLKPCFLYMGVFPEDDEIFVAHLIKLWIAEGFIKPLPPKTFEEMAEDYLKDLTDRSLILVRKRDHNGILKSCMIHDLLRELCVKKAQDEKFLQVMNSNVRPTPQRRNNQRRVSIHSDILHGLTNVHDWTVRSLLYFFPSSSDDWLVSFTASFRLQRIFNALTIIFNEFPIEIVELVRLRYLAFSYIGEIKIPASLSKLQNLQTLVVYLGRSSLSYTLCLPSNIWEMQQLRHLLFEKCILSAQITGKDPIALKNLQTLSCVQNFSLTRKVLEIMPNLKKLGTLYFHDMNTKWSSYKFNNFVHLHQLETLKYCFIVDPSCAQRSLPVQLTFPPNLRKLTLSGCRYSWKRMTIVGSLPNLEVLKLKDEAFKGAVWKPNEGEFSKLKFLLVDNTDLMYWRANDAHFPRLQHLRLKSCTQLMEIPSEIGEIATLEILELYDCSYSAEASAKLIQEEQQGLENNNLRVRVGSFQDNYESKQNTFRKKVYRYVFSR